MYSCVSVRESAASCPHRSRRAPQPIFRPPMSLPHNSGSARPSGRCPVMDVACTKIAVDLQNMQHEGAEESIRRSLETLREATSADAAFAVFFDASARHIESVVCARGHFAQCHPEALRGAAVESLPWLSGRVDHLRLSEFRDTASPRREQAEDAGTLAELAIGAALHGVVPHQGQAGGLSRAGLWAAARRLRRQSAAADEAAGHQPGDRAGACAAVGGSRPPRGAQRAGRAGRQRWAVGFRRRGQRCLLLTALARDARLRRGRSQGRLRLAQPRASGRYPRACRLRSASTSPARPRSSRASTACVTAAAIGAG